MTSKCLDQLVKIYDNQNYMLHSLGLIFASPLSKKIYLLLLCKKLTANELGIIIHGNINPKLSLVLFHLKKMLKIGLIIKTKIRNKKTGHKISQYKAIPIILIIPTDYVENISKNKKRILIELKKLVDKNLQTDF